VSSVANVATPDTDNTPLRISKHRIAKTHGVNTDTDSPASAASTAAVLSEHNGLVQHKCACCQQLATIARGAVRVSAHVYSTCSRLCSNTATSKLLA
jgi:hypothetical protein